MWSISFKERGQSSGRNSIRERTLAIVLNHPYTEKERIYWFVGCTKRCSSHSSFNWFMLERMELLRNVRSFLRSDHRQSRTSSFKSKLACFPFSVNSRSGRRGNVRFDFLRWSRMTNGVTHQLFPRHQRRSLKSNWVRDFSSGHWSCSSSLCLANKHQSQLTTNMDSYQSTPSDNELQQLLYA